MAQYLPGGAHEDIDIATFLVHDHSDEFPIKRSNQLATATSGASQFGPAQVTQALGKALIYDQSLSVNNNLACATCHVPTTRASLEARASSMQLPRLTQDQFRSPTPTVKQGRTNE